MGTSRPSSPAKPTVRSHVGLGRLFSGSFGVAVAERCREWGSVTRCSSGLKATGNAGGSWRDITPPRIEGYFDDVFFLDRQHGWAIVGDCSVAADAQVYRTADGGRTWQRSSVPSRTCNAGAGLSASFVDARHGWLVHHEPTAPFATVRQTSDGGRSWGRTLNLPLLAQLRFRDQENGWLGGSGFGPVRLTTTHDGGRDWDRVSLLRPAEYGRVRLLPDLPTFLDNGRGVLPVTLLRGRRADIAFYLSEDAGGSWTAGPVLRLGVEWGRRRTPWEAPIPTSIASSDVWWVLAGEPPSIHNTTDGGRSWRVAKTDLPAPGQLSAADSRTAWVYTSFRGGSLFVSRNGGRSWVRLRLL